MTNQTNQPDLQAQNETLIDLNTRLLNALALIYSQCRYVRPEVVEQIASEAIRGVEATN